jgi:uncharacterized membrane protein
MPFCPNCGAQVSGAFCTNCGTRVSGAGAASGTGAANAGASYSPPPPQTGAAQGLGSNAASALCYTPFGIGLICDIVFLIASPYNRDRTIRFNAFQSIFLHIALVVFWIAVHIVVAMFAFATHGFGFFAVGLYPALWLCILALFIVLMYKVYNNQPVKLPVIGDLAEKQA